MSGRQRQRSFLVSLLVIVLAASAGVAAASVLLNGTEDPGGNSDPVPGSASAEARADDPRGGLPFGVLVWRNAAGYTCAALGRRVADRITDASGTRDYPVESGGGCVDLAALSGDLDVRRSSEHRGQRAEPEPVTVVWGLARRGITQVQVRTERGDRVANVTPNGAFVVVFPGAVTSAFEAVAITNGERRRATTFPAVSAEIRDRILHPRTGEQVRREMLEQQRQSSGSHP